MMRIGSHHRHLERAKLYRDGIRLKVPRFEADLGLQRVEGSKAWPRLHQVFGNGSEPAVHTRTIPETMRAIGLVGIGVFGHHRQQCSVKVPDRGAWK